MTVPGALGWDVSSSAGAARRLGPDEIHGDRAASVQGLRPRHLVLRGLQDHVSVGHHPQEWSVSLGLAQSRVTRDVPVALRDVLRHGVGDQAAALAILDIHVYDSGATW
jgi:hypothetical protein